MKLFTAKQIKELDRFTVINEPITSIDLMERASEALFEAFLEHYDEGEEVFIFAGNGNNGGDALALARLLSTLHTSYKVTVILFQTDKRSPDNHINLTRLAETDAIHTITLSSAEDIPHIPDHVIVVDGIFGTGLSRTLEGLYADVVTSVNQSGAEVFSIDIPSGLFSEDNSNNDGVIIDASVVITFQFPKLSFMLSGSADSVRHWEVWDIGLHQPSIDAIPSDYCLVSEELIQSKFQHRNRFSHKGTHGHALLVAGKAGMIGAAVLATKACLRSGVGLITVHVPQHSGGVVQKIAPEAILSLDRSELMFTSVENTASYAAIGIGPAIGVKPNTRQALFNILQHNNKPIVIDADALNILSQNKEWLHKLPLNAVLTPHPKEFDRLTHDHQSGYDRLITQISKAKEWHVVIVLKGAYTSIVFPDGRCFFNPTGNHGLATGGAGDVLTGIILGLLAQGYSAEDASLVGVWWHGMAADMYATKYLAQSLIASDIVKYMREVQF